VIRLQHVAATFPPGREDDVRTFYGRVLGLREQAVPEAVADHGWIWFSTRDPGIELHFIPDERPPDATRMHHFCLQVGDLEEFRERLERAGAGPHAPAADIPARRRLFCRDPLGNLVELVEMEAG
jgi:catechol 2,3-dioxygenase-like lactoylglutathione lyase family enzyme